VRIAVAMSGGVDSSLAAALLVRQGHAVQGLIMRIWRERSAEATDDMTSAQQVCDHLGIPLHIADLRQEFHESIVSYFCDEYVRGRTPNPCLRCNRLLKFGRLLEIAQNLGNDALATGHYARIASRGGVYRLLAGTDQSKDQSYFMYTLGQSDLRRIRFPLGEMLKVNVREMAQAAGLPVADRPESQDACFVADGDYRRFLREHRPGSIQPGPILNAHGDRLGTHRGLPYYTIGQRTGLGIAAPKPLYVLRIEPGANRLVVGYAEELGHSALIAEEMSYVAGQPPADGTAIQAKIRYQSRPVSAIVWPGDGQCAVVRFAAPLRDITPGQAVVLYQGDQVVGGGIIQTALDA